jgi:hypothetical protein
MPTEQNANANAGIFANYETHIVAGLLVYFLARACFLAFNIEAGLPPDEVAHMRRVEIFHQPSGVPRDPMVLAAASYVPGEPALYYRAAAVLLRLNTAGVSDLVFLRLINAALGMVTVLYGWRWIRLFTANALTRILTVLIITNTLMFTVMSAAVSYDALVYVCAAAAIYHLTRYLLDQNPTQLLLMLLFIGIGTLTKTSFLPVGAIAVACAAIGALRALRSNGVPTRLNVITRTRIALFLTVIAVALANAWLYVPNLARYGKLVPDKEQVYSDSVYMSSPVWARNTITADFRMGRLSFRDAMILARDIENEHVRRDTEHLLRREEGDRREGLVFSPMPRYVYPIPWLRTMAETSFGLLAHESAVRTGVWLMPYGALALMAVAGLLMTWRPWRPENVENYLIVIVVFYALVLMQGVNYRAYLRSHELNIALQGRYLFPVLVPLAGLAAHYYLAPWSKRIQVGLFAVAAIIFLAGDLPFFLLTADTERFFGNP